MLLTGVAKYHGDSGYWYKAIKPLAFGGLKPQDKRQVPKPLMNKYMDYGLQHLFV